MVSHCRKIRRQIWSRASRPKRVKYFLAPSNCFTFRSKAVLLLWILFAIYVSCLSLLCCLVCCLQPYDHLLGKGWSLCSLVCCVSCVLSLSHIVSWVRCGTCLYRFLIFAFIFTLICSILCGLHTKTTYCTKMFTVEFLGNANAYRAQQDLD